MIAGLSTAASECHMPVNVPSTDSKYPHTPREVRAQVAASLAGYYSELSGLDEPAEPFSLGRFLRRLAEGMRLDGHENAVVEATRLIAGPQGDYSSFWLPFSVLSTRAMTSVPGPKGGYLTAPQTLGAVDVLRPASAAISAGMQVLENVTDGVVLPRVATDIALTWISENGPPQTESPPALGNASASPKTGVVLIRVSRQLLRQGSSVDPFLRALFRRKAGEALDKVVLGGAGGSEPMGLTNTPGVGSQSGVSLAHAGLLTMRKTVLNAGAQEAALAWIGPPPVQELLGARERAAQGGRFLWDAGCVLDSTAFATKNAPASSLIVGDFGQAVACIFGPGVQIDVDQSQGFNSNEVVFRLLLTVDVAFPQPSAFSVATSVT